MKNRVALLKRIIDFCKSSSVELVPLPKEALGEDTFEHRADVLGLQAAHAGLVSAQRNAVLLSDDWLYRSLIHNEHKVTGTCTQAILRAGVGKGELTNQSYQQAVLLLIKCHYTFVADEVATYIALIENGYGPDHELSQQILGRFASGEVGRVPAAAFLGIFLGHVRRNYSGPTQADWMKAIIDAFMKASPILADAGQFCLGLMYPLANMPDLFFDVLTKLSRDPSINPGLPAALHGCARGFVKEMGVLSRGFIGIQVVPSEWRRTWNLYVRSKNVLPEPS